MTISKGSLKLSFHWLLLALGSKSTSLSAGIHMLVQAVRYNLFSSEVFLPSFTMFILSLPLLELGSKSTFLSPGFYLGRPRQYDRICWELNLISWFFAFSGYLFGRMESINVAGVLQEAWDADSRAHTRSQVYVEYFIIPYTSTFIRLSHLYQEFCVHCIVI